jgi:hypothetical protein
MCNYFNSKKVKIQEFIQKDSQGWGTPKGCF